VIAREDSPDKLAIVQMLQTAPRARTMALDPMTHKIYLASAQFAAPANSATVSTNQVSGAPRR
jgi:hypothetical protein